mmetsp:Transcript_17021/g.20473  ORF Transcript_17021/g.20473 Transcript_17021/m.20473 type:complete len:464 (+) Transcript_17021:140-1531(+)
MEEWITTVGRIRYSDALAVVSDKNGEFSVRAKRDIDANQVIAQIPKSAVLSLKNVPIVETLLQNYRLDDDEDLALATAITFESVLGRESKWYGYLRSIPIKSIETPLGLPNEVLAGLLNGLDVLETIIQEKERLNLAWDLAVKPLLEECLPSLFHRKLNYQLFLRSFQIQSSRAFFVDEYHGNALVPFADMLNHKVSVLSPELHIEGGTKRASKTSGKLADRNMGAQVLLANFGAGEDSSEMVLTSLREISTGEEVLNTYGEHGNCYLFVEYGFVIRNNIFNETKLYLTEENQSDIHERGLRRRFRAITSKARSGDDSNIMDVLEIFNAGYITLRIRDTWHWQKDCLYWAILTTCSNSHFDKFIMLDSLAEGLDPFVNAIVSPSHDDEKADGMYSICVDAMKKLISITENRFSATKVAEANFRNYTNLERFSQATTILRHDEQHILRKASLQLKKKYMHTSND